MLSKFTWICIYHILYYFLLLISIFYLGTGEAGKTTFIKQMRIIHGSEYDENEIQEFKKIIFQNIYDGICKLGDAMDHLNISYKNTIPEVFCCFTVLLLNYIIRYL